MDNPSNTSMLSIGAAAEYLGISIDTLRRWEKKGRIEAYRSPGGHRYFKKEELDNLFGKKYAREDSDIQTYVTDSVQTTPPESIVNQNFSNPPNYFDTQPTVSTVQNTSQQKFDAQPPQINNSQPSTPNQQYQNDTQQHSVPQNVSQYTPDIQVPENEPSDILLPKIDPSVPKQTPENFHQQYPESPPYAQRSPTQPPPQMYNQPIQQTPVPTTSDVSTNIQSNQNFNYAPESVNRPPTNPEYTQVHEEAETLIPKIQQSSPISSVNDSDNNPPTFPSTQNNQATANEFQTTKSVDQKIEEVLKDDDKKGISTETKLLIGIAIAVIINIILFALWFNSYSSVSPVN